MKSRNRKQLLGYCCVALVLIGVTVSVERIFAQDELTDIEEVVNALVEREAAVKTASGYFSWESFTNSDKEVIDAVAEPLKSALAAPPSLIQVFWATDGIKVREDTQSVFPEDLKLHELTSYDGNVLQKWEFGQKDASEWQRMTGVPKNISNSPAPWLQLSVGMPQPEKLSGQLTKDKVRYVGSEILAGLKVWRIESISVKGDKSSHTWWVAAERDGLVIKHERRSLIVAAKSGVESWRHVHIVDQMSRKNGIWVPTKARFLILITPRGKTEMWERLEKVTSTSLSINSPVENMMFRLPLPARTQVNVLANPGYVVKENIKSFTPILSSSLEKENWKFDRNDLLSEPNLSLDSINESNE